jgi:DNA-binding PadR family transcriptional regulator
MSIDTPPPTPLKPHVFLVLMALVDGQMHGYEIRKDVEQRSGGTVRLDPGTLYRHVGRLLDEGLISESDERPDDDDARRRYYNLTDAGIAAVEAEAERMAALVDAVRDSKLSKARATR